MVRNPASASCLIVPGKSLAIISLTGHVWHPIGMPSGLARSSSAHAERKPAAATFVAAFFKNSLLETADIDALLARLRDQSHRHSSGRTHYTRTAPRKSEVTLGVSAFAERDDRIRRNLVP